jgi:hypothetical protein
MTFVIFILALFGALLVGALLDRTLRQWGNAFAMDGAQLDSAWSATEVNGMVVRLPPDPEVRAAFLGDLEVRSTGGIGAQFGFNGPSLEWSF